ncbi:dnaJ homolog subfamily C member 27 isoform X2 [Fukomys damarensis]|uniref:dnaJ homolog subfamily C member 27 isoform X2 n=1 Tax=Fukomys damarensis TaxID=885580 RepID=UPI001455548B|nr:dnaJ homolog subfamily C member 27 isoform X2 [Fukomys damarensis]
MAGHPFFYEVRNEFYKDTQGVILVYDVGQKESFDALDAWLAEMKQELGPHANMDSVIFVVCANKIDCTKHRCVSESEGRLWAESKGFLYFETSAQTGEGINEMFQNPRSCKMAVPSPPPGPAWYRAEVASGHQAEIFRSGPFSLPFAWHPVRPRVSFPLHQA